MKIYKISQNINNKYDTYDSAIVYAENEEKAKEISPEEHYKYHDNSWYFQYADGSERAEESYSWTHPDNVKVKYLGDAVGDVEEGIILASFNAG